MSLNFFLFVTQLMFTTSLLAVEKDHTLNKATTAQAHVELDRRQVAFIEGPHSRIELVDPVASGDGRTFYFGLRFKLDRDWHIYWKNPGDSGAAPKIHTEGSDFKIIETYWPVPDRIKVAHLTNLGYSREATLYFKAEALSHVIGWEKPIVFKLNLEWLICKIECIPGFGDLMTEKSMQVDPSTVDKILRLRPAETIVDFQIKKQNDKKITLVFPKLLSAETISTIDGKLKNIEIFPQTSDVLAPAEPYLTQNASDLEVEFTKVSSNEIKNIYQQSFLFAQNGKAFEITSPLKSAAVAAVEGLGASEESTSLPMLLLLAFVGGLILNLMPCVFPLISIKAFSLLKGHSKERRTESFFYSLGVIVSFLVLGGLFLILKNLGQSVGWGFQLQSPVFVYFIIVIFWILSLSFAGYIELGDSLAAWFGRIQATSGFFSGVLAVLVATPCTGPFLGAALGATLFLPTVQSLMVFFFLGLGMALPYTLIAISPKLVEKLPRPGAWMEKLKQFFAFPLLLTVIWLFWVVDLQTDATVRTQILLVVLAVTFYFWLLKLLKKQMKAIATIAILAYAIYIGYQIYFHAKEIQEAPVVAHGDKGVDAYGWQPFSKAKLQELLDKDQKVFVDFTAAWCITCQVNKKQVLDKPNVNQYFIDQQIVRMRADWTKPNPEIADQLKILGRNSIPVYALYAGKDKEPVLLPQIITFGMIMDEVDKLTVHPNK